eukprot:scaffold21179_cov47-Attheya_sp.AAC.2
MPRASTTEEASAAARDLIEALNNPGPASPLAPLSDSKRQALFQLADIFVQATDDCSPSPPTTPIAIAPLPVAAPPRVPTKEKIVAPPRVVTPPRVSFAEQPPTSPATYASKTRRARAKRAKQTKIDAAATNSVRRQKQLRQLQVPATSANLNPTVAVVPPSATNTILKVSATNSHSQ